MKHWQARLFLLSSIALLALMFAASTASPADACIIGPDSDFECGWIPRPQPAPTSTPTPVALKIVNIPSGDSPTTARDITGAWQSIPPGGSVWYKTPYSDGYRNIELWVDSPAQNALGLALFSPDQQVGAWTDWKPVGRGTFNARQPEHVLAWIAGYARSGVWFALIQNYTNAPVSYRLAGNLSSADVKKCHSYWEYLPSGAHVYWTDCGHYTQVPD